MSSSGLLTKRRVRTAASRSVLHAVLVAGGAMFSLPFLWLIVTSFKTREEIFRVPVTWIPDALRDRPVNWPVLFENFENAREFIPFWTWLGNTCWVTFLCVVFNVMACGFVAYGFSRIRWRGRDTVFILVLATLMLPAQVTMIPQFLIFNALGWYNTLKPLWFHALFGSAFHIFLLRQFMMTLPLELEEAAKIDGCGHFRIFSTITLPPRETGVGGGGRANLPRGLEQLSRRVHLHQHQRQHDHGLGPAMVQDGARFDVR